MRARSKLRHTIVEHAKRASRQGLKLHRLKSGGRSSVSTLKSICLTLTYRLSETISAKFAVLEAQESATLVQDFYQPGKYATRPPLKPAAPPRSSILWHMRTMCATGAAFCQFVARQTQVVLTLSASVFAKCIQSYAVLTGLIKRGQK